MQLAEQLKPHVIVMDMAMPGFDGVQATREILKNLPKTAILILSMYCGSELRPKRPGRGREGIPFENAMEVELAAAVKEVAAGKQVIGPGLMKPAPEPDDELRPAHAARKADSAAHRPGQFE